MEKKSKNITNIKAESLRAPYLPVAWEYREVIDEEIKKKASGKVFYFCHDEGICEARGCIMAMEEKKDGSLYIVLDTEVMIRVDRIITLFGKPGAAYDEYDAYANSCMDCTGGYEEDD